MSYDIFLQKFYLNKVKPYEKYEKEASEKIKIIFNVEIYELFNKSNGNKYDFIAGNKKYEVKYDASSNVTGNFYIEYSGYGKPSGISISEADYYIITNGKQYYMIDINILKTLCKKYGIIRTTKDKLTFGHCINTNIIIENSIII